MSSHRAVAVRQLPPKLDSPAVVAGIPGSVARPDGENVSGAEPGTAGQPPAADPNRAPAGVRRTGAALYALVAGAIVLILLLVFILENTESVKITYFGAGGHISLGVALLLAAVGGALLTGLVGVTHVFQLRRRIKHLRR